jgi:hypothetical protein
MLLKVFAANFRNLSYYITVSRGRLIIKDTLENRGHVKDTTFYVNTGPGEGG